MTARRKYHRTPKTNQICEDKKRQEVTEKERSKINKQLETLDKEIDTRLPKLQKQ